MVGAGSKRRSDVRVTIVAASFAAVALVGASVACGSFSGDDANAGGGGDASSAEVIAADAPSGGDTSTASDAATDVADAGVDTGAARHLSVFVLSMPWSIGTTYDDGGAKLGGRDSADGFCADEGAAAGLGSSFQAFMSRPNMDAISRLPSDADWSLPNAAGPKDLVFASRAAIDLGQNPLHMLNRGAGGLPLADDETAVWTGTNAAGRATGDDCSDWGIYDTATTGRTDSLGPSWANAGSTACGHALHVFCFGY